MDESGDQQSFKSPVKKKHSHKFIRNEISKFGSFEDPDLEVTSNDCNHCIVLRIWKGQNRVNKEENGLMDVSKVTQERKFFWKK